MSKIPLPEPITQWAIDRGISWVESTVKAWLDIPDPNALIKMQVEFINSKLDIILAAPYKQALMHLRAGRFELAEAKLVEAMTYNELDLAALRLYADLLRMRQEYALALDYNWEILDKFGFRQNLVPPFLFDAYVKRYFETKVGSGAGNITLYYERDNDLVCPKRVFCSPSAMGLAWHYPWTTIFRWNGERILSESGNLELLTNTYAVLSKRGKYRTYRLSDGKLLPHEFSESEFRALFMPPIQENLLTSRISTTNLPFAFCNAMITCDTETIEDIEERDIGPGPQLQVWVYRTYRQIQVRFSG